MKYGFIYIITNKLNGKKYIGMRKYSRGWESYMGSSKPLKSDMERLGISNFSREIVEECESSIELQEREIFHLKNNNVPFNENFYNQSIPHKEFRIKGNTNSSKGKSWEDIYGIEGAKRRRENNKLRGKDWKEIYGVEYSEIKRSVAKQKRTIETRLKMSKSRMGIKYSDETKRRISVGIKNHYSNKHLNV